ncbi:MAG: ribosome silencing factor [Termitinemataceae bacterium]|nr:MAG: ribosome silencing factor [Termitinemataceae bacterium]
MDDIPKTKKAAMRKTNDASKRQLDEQDAIDFCALLKEHNGGSVALLDMRALNMWTDFFIVVTVTSSTHLGGLQKHLKDMAREKKIKILNGNKKIAAGDEWQYCDLGHIVIHLMSEKAREFYDLENLYIDAKITRF